MHLSLPSDSEIQLQRAFDASRERVFEALTNPQQLMHWFAQPAWRVATCEIDLRTSGECRIVLRNANGEEMTMRGIYLEIARPERIVRSESFEGWPTVQSTIELTAQGGTTLMTATIRYPARESRDQDLAGGMERDAAATYEILAEYLRASA
jgi:uncharacterized protein YndB with AHSA1/START domain